MQHALLDTMAGQVEQRCQERLVKARKEAEAIVAAAREKAAKQRSETLDRTNREMERLAERARELAALQVDLEALSMRHAVADEVLQSVHDELARIAEGPGFPAVLESLLAEVMRAAPPQAEIVAPVGRGDVCRDWLNANGHAGLPISESAALKDGVAVQDPARTFRVTNSLSARFQILENQARQVCLGTLFGEGTT